MRVRAIVMSAATLALAALALGGGGGDAGALVPSTRVAIVIGNAAYSSSPLPNPRNDARAVTGTLRELGFEVHTFEDATRPAMKQLLQQLPTMVEPGDLALFYYAGSRRPVPRRQLPAAGRLRDRAGGRAAQAESGARRTAQRHGRGRRQRGRARRLSRLSLRAAARGVRRWLGRGRHQGRDPGRILHGRRRYRAGRNRPQQPLHRRLRGCTRTAGARPLRRIPDRARQGARGHRRPADPLDLGLAREPLGAA